MTFSEGRNLLQLNGRTHRFRGDIPWVGPRGLLDLARAQWAIDRMARRLGPPPWTGGYAARLDAQTLRGWMRRRVHTRAGRLVLEVATAASFACRPEELSPLAYRIDGGAAGLPERLAKELSGRILLNHPVDEIRRTRDRVALTVRGKLALPAESWSPRIRARPKAIRHDPPLPAGRNDLQRRWPMGHGNEDPSRL